MRKLATLACLVILCSGASAQSLCRQNSNNLVRWVSGSSCPAGTTAINNSVRSRYLRDEIVTTGKIDDLAVTAGKLANNSVIAGKIAPGAINSANLFGTGVIDSNALADNAVITSKIAEGAVTESKIGGQISHSKINFTGWTVPSNSVGTGQIQDGAVTNAKVASGISHAKIDFTGWTVPSNSVGTNQIRDGSVTDTKILGVSFSKVTGVLINDSHVASGANIDHSKINFTGWTVPSNSVGTNQIQTGAVTGDKIADGAITDAKFSTNATDRLKAAKVDFVFNSSTNNFSIDWGVVDTSVHKVEGSDIAAEAITDAKIASNAAIQGSKIATGSIPWDRIQSGSVSVSGGVGGSIVDDSIESVDIKDGTITDADISGTADISGSKIADNSLPEGKIQGQISWSKVNTTGASLPFNAITGVSITDSHVAENANIDGSKLAANSVTGTQIDESTLSGIPTSALMGTITNAQIQDNAVTEQKIQNGAVTNFKLNIKPEQPLPIVGYIGKTSVPLANATTEYLYPAGKTAPSLTNDLLFNFADCREFVFGVYVENSPGVGKSWEFYLHNGSSNLSTKCEIAGSSTTCDVGPFQITGEHTPFQIKSVPVNSPAATHAQWYIVCRPNFGF